VDIWCNQTPRGATVEGIIHGGGWENLVNEVVAWVFENSQSKGLKREIEHRKGV